MISSGFMGISGVGSRFTGKRCGYGPELLMLRCPDPGFFCPICTILGGVLPLFSPNADGELLRTIFNPWGLLVVSSAAFPVLIDRLKRGISLTVSCRGGEDGSRFPSSKSCVTFENMIAGGGSSSESLSLTPTWLALCASTVKLGL